MSFAIIPIGVNEAFSCEGFQTNFIVESRKQTLLVDCGSTASRALAHCERALVDIDSVYISHMHLDHVGGLPELGLQRYLAGRDRPRIFIQQSLVRPLWENFLSGLLSRYVDKSGKSRVARAETFFEFVPISFTANESDRDTAINDLRIRPVQVMHIQGAPSYGLIVNDTVFLTTDTVFMPDLLEEISNRFGVQAIFHDCSFRQNQKFLHTTYEELCTLPEDLKQLLILTHYESDYKHYLKKGQKLELTLAEPFTTYEF